MPGRKPALRFRFLGSVPGHRSCGGIPIAPATSLPRPVNEITGQVIDAALRIHNCFGPGLLESVCQKLLARELSRRGLHVELNRGVSFEFDALPFQNAVFIDLLIEDSVIVEVKSVEKLAAVHLKQVLTYLRVSGLEVGLLINFGAATLKEGLHRVVNNYGRPRTMSTGDEPELDDLPPS